jgi:hypothetical protein
MHHRNRSWLANGLKHSQGTNRIEHPPTSIAHHRSFCLFLAWDSFDFYWLRLTQGRVDTKDLVRVQTRVWAGQNHNAGPSTSHCRSHLHQPWGSLIGFRELAGMVSVFVMVVCVHDIPVTNEHLGERASNHLKIFAKILTGWNARCEYRW